MTWNLPVTTTMTLHFQPKALFATIASWLGGKSKERPTTWIMIIISSTSTMEMSPQLQKQTAFPISNQVATGGWVPKIPVPTPALDLRRY